MERALKICPSLFSKPFNNLFWRQFLSDICKNMESTCRIEIISPFGFELLNDKTFLNKNIRRHYCYIGVDKNDEYIISKTVADFKKKLFEALACHDKKKINDFVLLIEQTHFKKLKNDSYVCLPDDKLIDIQCRYAANGILDDYANYIICCLDAICRGKGEASDFFNNKRHRNRTYQLYLMLESLFQHLLESLSEEKKPLFNKIARLIDNRIDLFFNEKLLFSPPSREESEIFYSLIEPRIHSFRDAVKNNNLSENIVVNCSGYHVDDYLELTISKHNYQTAKDKIIKTYLQFI